MQSELEINFYHLTTTPLINALPKILDKVVSSNLRAVVVFKDQEKMEEFNAYLWSFSTKTVIPHGSCNDDFPEEQPVYLTTKFENPNNSSVLIIIDDIDHPDLKHFNKCLYIFDGNIDEELNKARAKWQQYTKLNYQLIYWKQDDKGQWQKHN